VGVVVCQHSGNMAQRNILPKCKPVCCQLFIILIPSSGDRGYSLKVWLDDPILRPHHLGSYPLVEKQICMDVLLHRLQQWLKAASGYSIRQGSLQNRMHCFAQRRPLQCHPQREPHANSPKDRMNSQASAAHHASLNMVAVYEMKKSADHIFFFFFRNGTRIKRKTHGLSLFKWQSDCFGEALKQTNDHWLISPLILPNDSWTYY